MISSETNDSNDMENNNQPDIFEATSQILELTTQSQASALFSNQNINTAVGILDTAPEKTNVTYSLYDTSVLDANTTTQGLSYSSIN